MEEQKEEVQNEQEEEKRIKYYIFNYLTEPCPNLSIFRSPGKGQHCKTKDCPYYHSIKERRRKLKRVTTTTSGWNYQPSLCSYKMKGKYCPFQKDCPYAHNRNEIQYHFLMYRTELCKNSFPESCGYVHCPYSHSLSSLRKTIPSFPFSLLINEKQQKNRTDYICPTEKLKESRKYYIENYKIIACENQDHFRHSYTDEMKLNCIYYHPTNNNNTNSTSLEKQGRRSPLEIKYYPNLCSKGRKCLQKQYCDHARNLLEIMYHPLIYKTRLCNYFKEEDETTWDKCRQKIHCAHAHSEEELFFNQQESKLYAEEVNNIIITTREEKEEEKEKQEKQTLIRMEIELRIMENFNEIGQTEKNSLSFVSSSWDKFLSGPSPPSSFITPPFSSYLSSKTSSIQQLFAFKKPIDFIY